MSASGEDDWDIWWDLLPESIQQQLQSEGKPMKWQPLEDAEPVRAEESPGKEMLEDAAELAEKQQLEELPVGRESTEQRSPREWDPQPAELAEKQQLEELLVGRESTEQRSPTEWDPQPAELAERQQLEELPVGRESTEQRSPTEWDPEQEMEQLPVFDGREQHLQTALINAPAEQEMEQQLAVLAGGGNLRVEQPRQAATFKTPSRPVQAELRSTSPLWTSPISRKLHQELLDVRRQRSSAHLSPTQTTVALTSTLAVSSPVHFKASGNGIEVPFSSARASSPVPSEFRVRGSSPVPVIPSARASSPDSSIRPPTSEKSTPLRFLIPSEKSTPLRFQFDKSSPLAFRPPTLAFGNSPSLDHVWNSKFETPSARMPAPPPNTPTTPLARQQSFSVSLLYQKLNNHTSTVHTSSSSEQMQIMYDSMLHRMRNRDDESSQNPELSNTSNSKFIILLECRN
jgi:hypothetical protein